ncbi:MAG: Mitochondrial fission protein [Phylliscum demangeonii]|nr:MAG: Mitochondrial fission protein [Phylliscum demangeonii]
MAESGNHHASSSGRSTSAGRPPRAREEESTFGTTLSARNIEAFSRTVTTTAGHIMGPLGDVGSNNSAYAAAMGQLHKGLRRPGLQRRVFSIVQASPREIVRSTLSTSEMQSRALAYVPDELLNDVPEDNSTYSLFQGFQATMPEAIPEPERKDHRRQGSRGRKLLTDADREARDGSPSLAKMQKERHTLSHRLEMLGIRKNMASSEIREIDGKIGGLNHMRRIVLDRLAELEQEESAMEHELLEADNRIEDMQEELDATPEASQATPPASVTRDSAAVLEADNTTAMDASFMSESIYGKLPSPRSARRHKAIRRKSMPVLHEHLESGSKLREIQAHNDLITALDFDVPFGTMVTAALDDTVRVWDLNAGRCIGMLEGHHASVRCLQVEDNLVATGSTDASIRLWDLSRADYQAPPTSSRHRRRRHVADEDDESDDNDNDNDDDDDDDGATAAGPSSSLHDCHLLTLEAHVDEVTALHFQGDTLVSGSADKTLRQWDLQKGRCVQTLDVLWAAAHAATVNNHHSTGTGSNNTGNPLPWRQTTSVGAGTAGTTGTASQGRLPSDATADFVGALQCFDAALACGTADGMVRLWDLRSGQVHRSLIGHTGPVTSLQFDDVHLVTGSMDRSIRIWDLRTGSIYDAYGYDHGVTSMMFDARRIVAAAGEPVVKVYDKADGRHWDCGGGLGVGVPGLAAVYNEDDDDGFAVLHPPAPPSSSSAASASAAAAAAAAATGATTTTTSTTTPAAAAAAIVEKVRIKDGYLIDGRKDGMVGIWAC